MLNENKVKLMTKMAIYEKNEGRKMIKTAKFFKSDYVSLGVLKTVIASSVAFILIIAMAVICNIQNLADTVSGTVDYASIGGKFVGYYVAFVLGCSVVSGVVYAWRYDESRNELKKYISRLNKLEHFYGMSDKKNNN